MKTKGWCTALSLVLTVFQFTNGQTYKNRTNLMNDLLVDYDPDVRPLLDQSQIIQVNMSLFLYSILQVDSVQGIVTLVVGTNCVWKDELLLWNAADYGNINTVTVKHGKIWAPPLLLSQPAEIVQMGDSWDVVYVSSNGMIHMTPGAIIKNNCNFNVKFWPFDKQKCDVVFLLAGYNLWELQINLMDPPLRDFKIAQNSEWTLEGYSYRIKTNLFATEAVFTLHLKRQAMFYVITIILPLTAMFVISPVVYVMPIEQGERSGFSVTIMLTMAVFLTVVSDQMPKTSSPISILCIYILIGTISNILVLLIVILNDKWYNKKEANGIRSFHRFIYRVSKFKFSNKILDSSARKEQKSASLTITINSHSVSELELEDNLEINKEDAKQEADKLEEERITWQDISEAVDKISFWFFFPLCVLMSIIFIAYTSAASSYDT